MSIPYFLCEEKKSTQQHYFVLITLNKIANVCVFIILLCYTEVAYDQKRVFIFIPSFYVFA